MGEAVGEIPLAGMEEVLAWESEVMSPQLCDLEQVTSHGWTSLSSSGK